MGKRNDKLLSGLSLALLLAGSSMAARKTTAAVWSRSVRDDPPPKKRNVDVGLAEALGWAMLSGAAVGLARMLVRRSVVYSGTPLEEDERSSADGGSA